MLESCDVKAVIQLDPAVFRPYTAQPTSILIFERRRNKRTRFGFFEVTDDGFKKNTSKKGRPPIKENDLPMLRMLWNTKEETEKSFFVDFDTIKGAKEDYKLFMNYHKPRAPIKNPKELAEICEVPILGGTPPKKDKDNYGGKSFMDEHIRHEAKAYCGYRKKIKQKGKRKAKKQGKSRKEHCSCLSS